MASDDEHLRWFAAQTAARQEELERIRKTERIGVMQGAVSVRIKPFVFIFKIQIILIIRILCFKTPGHGHFASRAGVVRRRRIRQPRVAA